MTTLTAPEQASRRSADCRRMRIVVDGSLRRIQVKEKRCDWVEVVEGGAVRLTGVSVRLSSG
jgi:hypothetical protein